MVTLLLVNSTLQQQQQQQQQILLKNGKYNYYITFPPANSL